jgi:hypothetical protein
MHYHVGSNTPGYSPEGDVTTYSSKRYAALALAAEVRRYREDEWELPRSLRRTGHGSAADGYVKFERPNDSYDLGLVFWWSRCDASDCADDGEE